MLKDLGIRASITLFTESSVARGIIHLVGLRKLRHLHTGYLWLQAAVEPKRLQVRKVLGAENPADLFTKHLSLPPICGGAWGAWQLRQKKVAPERCQ